VNRTKLGAAAVRRLRADPEFQALIPNYIGVDSTFPEGWVFQGLSDTGNRPYRDPEGTGKCAVVLGTRDSWAGPNQHNTANFPLLRVHIYADPSRDINRNMTARDADQKAHTVWRVIDRLFHDAGNQHHQWDNLYVTSCLRGSEPSIMDVPQGDGLVRLDATYNVIL